jgi:hypothetical protein
MSEPRVPKAVRQYKDVLRRVLESRPSGTRQRLAMALGTDRSFISQISNPAYKVAIPVHHVDTIVDVCHFSPDDRSEFLGAYDKAHPGQRPASPGGADRRMVTLVVPDLGNARANRLFDDALRDLARGMARLWREK